jgi:membrane-associated phospholipid phosphatase
MGAGLLAVPLTTSVELVAPALIAAAAGFGIVSTTGYPVLATITPPGEAGGYTALFFGGVAALAALVPLARFACRRPRWLRIPDSRWLVRWAGSLAALYVVVLATGLVVGATALHELDETAFRAVNAFGPGPELLFELLEEPGRNYLLLTSVPLAAALLAGPRRIPGVLALELAGALAVGLLNGVYALYDRPRPSEVFDSAEVALAYGHDWARIEAFPSGHMAVVTALAATAWFFFPRLRYPLIAYVVLNGVTRVLFGAHFPLDVVAGIALGYGSARAVQALFVQTGVIAKRATEQRSVAR